MPKTTPYRPSNGTEGECFMERWCARCTHDAAMRNDPGAWETGCQIIAMTLAFDVDDPEYPAEWIEDDVEWPAPSNPRCTAFQPEAGRDDGPIEDARQGALL